MYPNNKQVSALNRALGYGDKTDAQLYFFILKQPNLIKQY